MRIAIINGPNLNLTGQREEDIYGKISFDQFMTSCRDKYANQEISYFQSNSEGAIIDEIHQQGKLVDAMIINAGAYSHTSIAIADAVKCFPKLLIIEVHLSNVFARENFRKHSFISAVSQAVICGMGIMGYDMAIQYLLVKNQEVG